MTFPFAPLANQWGLDTDPPSFIAPSTMNARVDAKLNLAAAAITTLGTGLWTSYTPVLTAITTNPTLGTGSSATGRFVQVGKLVVAQGGFSFGTAGVAAGSGNYVISLPVTADTTLSNRPIGAWVPFDSSAGAGNALCLAFLTASTTMQARYPATWPNGATTPISNAAPWVWAASDTINFSIVYEAA